MFPIYDDTRQVHGLVDLMLTIVSKIKCILSTELVCTYERCKEVL